MGKKSAANSMSAIERSRTRTFARFLYALGIPHVGETASALLATRYGRIEDLMQAGEKELKAIPGIGPEIAESITTFFKDAVNRTAVRRLLEEGIRVVYGARGKKTLEGRTFVFTGALGGMTREEARNLVEERGGRTASSLSQSVDYLVAGKGGGSKRQKARDLGIRTITEGEFMKMVGR
jgi:DNA ligase (NAD+)